MPFMTNGKRDYKKEDAWDRDHKGRKQERTERHKARAEMVKEGVISKHSSKQIDHKTPLSKGGSNSRSNLRAISAAKNESYPRNKDGSMKRK